MLHQHHRLGHASIVSDLTAARHSQTPTLCSCSLMQCYAAVQSTSNGQKPYFISASFELRLDKNDQDSSRPQDLTDSWHDLQDRNERQVQRHEVHRHSVSRQILQLEVAQVGAINDHNPGVCSQTLSHLHRPKQHHQILHAYLNANA